MPKTPRVKKIYLYDFEPQPPMRWVLTPVENLMYVTRRIQDQQDEINHLRFEMNMLHAMVMQDRNQIEILDKKSIDLDNKVQTLELDQALILLPSSDVWSSNDIF